MLVAVEPTLNEDTANVALADNALVLGEGSTTLD